MAASAIAAACATIFFLLLAPVNASAGIVALGAGPGGAQSRERELCDTEEQDEAEDEEDAPLLLDVMSMMQTIRSVDTRHKEHTFKAEATLAPEQTHPQPHISEPTVAVPLAQAIEPDARRNSAMSTVTEENDIDKYFYTTVVVSLTVFLALVAVSLLFVLTLRDPARKPRGHCCLNVMKAHPELSLQKVGASFVVPLKRISRCPDKSFGFDITVLRAGVPLYAMLSRPAQEQPWTKVVLTVDVLMAADLPPLFSCELFPGCVARPEASQAGNPWLLVYNGKGTPVASVVVLSDGRCALRRWGLPDCTIEGSLGGPEPWISLSNGGERIARAMNAEKQAGSRGPLTAKLEADAEVGVDEDEDRGCTLEREPVPQKEFRIDTETDTQSPDACLLLLVMLAIAVFPTPKGALSMNDALGEKSVQKAKPPPSIVEPPVISAAERLMDAAAEAR
mmetsp:Transcript_130562/g.279118  ORF Transcript_130562/g.279118 Transcript_130562/m.279118 type:complete len:450 (-) Transcript_130562:56-1405(-)